MQPHQRPSLGAVADRVDAGLAGVCHLDGRVRGGSPGQHSGTAPHRRATRPDRFPADARQAPEPGSAATVRQVDLRQAGNQGLAGRAAARRSAGPAHRSNPAGKPPGVGEGAAQQELDLGVGAAQFVGCPSGKGVVDGWVEPQQDALAFAHWLAMPWVTGRGSRC